MIAPLLVPAGVAAGDLPEPDHDPGTVRELADEILSRSRYAPPRKSWLERILDWIGRQLDRIFGDGFSIGGGSGGSSLVTLVLLVAAIALVVLLIARWRRPARRDADGDAVVLRIDEQRSAREWMAAAVRAEEAGDWKEGLRCRFAALVAELVADGTLPPVPGRTAGEFRTDVRETAPAVADPFADAAELFERAWYGDLPTGPDEAERFAGHAGSVLAGIGRPR